MTDNTMREGKLWAFLHNSIHEAYKKLSTTGTNNEYYALLDSIAAEVADGVDARFLQAAQSVPEGWKLVPVEPTDEMISSGCDAANAFRVDMCRAWDAMLTASPEVCSHD